MKNMNNALEALGFSVHDASVYLALLKVGESSVGAIIEETGIHRELVYGGLKRLEQQGLVQSLEKKKIRHYQASEPQALIRKVEEKVELAKSILPNLKQMFRKIPVAVKIYEGAEGFEEVQKDIQASLQDNEEYYVIGASGAAFYDVTRDFFRTYRKKCMKRGISEKLVTFENEIEALLENEVPGFFTARVLPQEFAVPSSTKIYADKIVIQAFGEIPIAVMIRSEAVSKSYKQYFRALWKMGRTVRFGNTSD